MECLFCGQLVCDCDETGHPWADDDGLEDDYGEESFA